MDARIYARDLCAPEGMARNVEDGGTGTAQDLSRTNSLTLTSGMVNVSIVPDVQACDRAALQGVFVLIDGILQKGHGVINIMARCIADLSSKPNKVLYESAVQR